jgi:hypothetical protein
MNIRLALRLSAVALAVCLIALVSDLAVYLLRIHVAPTLKTALDALAFVWPLAMVFFGTYLRKVQAEPKGPPA